MEKTNNASLYWYVFYNDQLLLQKKAEGYVIPCTDEASTQSQTASSSSKEAVPAKNRCNTFLSIRYISTSRKQPPKILSEYFHLPLFSGC